MKNAILKTKYVLLALVILFTFSCGEDGAVGPQGPAGKDGQNGTNGRMVQKDWMGKTVQME